MISPSHKGGGYPQILAVEPIKNADCSRLAALRSQRRRVLLESRGIKPWCWSIFPMKFGKNGKLSFSAMIFPFFLKRCFRSASPWHARFSLNAHFLRPLSLSLMPWDVRRKLPELFLPGIFMEFLRDFNGIYLVSRGFHQRFHLWMSFSGWLINRRFPYSTSFFPQKQCCLFSSNPLYVNECFKRKKLIMWPLYLASLPLHLRHWEQPSQLVFITHSGHNKWRFPKMWVPQNAMENPIKVDDFGGTPIETSSVPGARCYKKAHCWWARWKGTVAAKSGLVRLRTSEAWMNSCSSPMATDILKSILAKGWCSEKTLSTLVSVSSNTLLVLVSPRYFLSRGVRSRSSFENHMRSHGQYQWTNSTPSWIAGPQHAAWIWYGSACWSEASSFGRNIKLTFRYLLYFSWYTYSPEISQKSVLKKCGKIQRMYQIFNYRFCWSYRSNFIVWSRESIGERAKRVVTLLSPIIMWLIIIWLIKVQVSLEVS